MTNDITEMVNARMRNATQAYANRQAAAKTLREQIAKARAAGKTAGQSTRTDLPRGARGSAMTEAQLQALVVELCGHLNLLIYHTHDSRRSNPGWPDLAIAGTRLIVRELKTATGRVTTDQAAWLAALANAGVDAAVWRPADWPDRIHAELKAIRTPNPPSTDQETDHGAR